MNTNVVIWTQWFNSDIITAQIRDYVHEMDRSPINAIVVTSVDQLDLEIEKYRGSTPLEILFIDPPSTSTEVWEYLASDKSTIKWVHSPAAGVDKAMKTLAKLNQLQREKVMKKVIYTRRAGRVTPQSMSEYILMYMLTTERSYDRMKKQSQQRVWTREEKGCRLLSDCRVGIMGYGEIGKYIAETLNKSFGIQINILRKGEPVEDKHVEQWFSTSKKGDLEGFLANDLDYIVAILPSTEETRHLLNNNVLKSCEKHPPVLISLGRGDIISDTEVVKALDNKWLTRACMDVFEEEPLPKESILWDRKDVDITPHCSCISTAVKKEVVESFFTNLDLYLSNKELQFPVDWSKGY